MTTFVPFTENNEWEGETWTFWIQAEGNDAALYDLAQRLAFAMDNEDAEGCTWCDEFDLDLTETEDEESVDVLVKHAGGDYMDEHQKLVGKLIVPTGLYGKALSEALYKGGICDFIKKES